MTTEQYSEAINVPEWKVKKVAKLLNEGVKAGEIQKRLSITNAKIGKINSWFLMKFRESKRVELERKEEPQRYWQNEDEMQIQDYKAEDLKGDELLILNELK